MEDIPNPTCRPHSRRVGPSRLYIRDTIDGLDLTQAKQDVNDLAPLDDDRTDMSDNLLSAVDKVTLLHADIKTIPKSHGDSLERLLEKRTVRFGRAKLTEQTNPAQPPPSTRKAAPAGSMSPQSSPWTGQGQGIGQGQGQGSPEWMADQNNGMSSPVRSPPSAPPPSKAATTPQSVKATTSVSSRYNGQYATAVATTQQDQLQFQQSPIPSQPTPLAVTSITTFPFSPPSSTFPASLLPGLPTTMKPLPTVTISPIPTSTALVLSPGASGPRETSSISTRPITPYRNPASGGRTDADQAGSSSTSMSSGGVAALVIGVIVIVTLCCFGLCKLFRTRHARGEIIYEKEYGATPRPKRRSSLFGGSDKFEGKMASEPSWVAGFMDEVAMPDPPSFNGRFSKRGSGWMILSEEEMRRPQRARDRQPPNNRNRPDEKRSPEIHPDSRSSSSSTDAVITTASRVSAYQSTTMVSLPSASSIYPTQPTVNAAASFKQINTHGHTRMPTDSSSSTSELQYPEDVYRYESSSSLSHPHMTKVVSSNVAGPPGNTMIGAATSVGQPTSTISNSDLARLRGAADGFREGVSGKMARAREPLRIVNKKKGIGLGLGMGMGPGTRKQSLTYTHARVPSRAYHSSFTLDSADEDDEDPFAHDKPPDVERPTPHHIVALAGDRSKSGTKQAHPTPSLSQVYGSPYKTHSPGPTSHPHPSIRTSFWTATPVMESLGSMMLTDYDTGGILPVHMESPPVPGGGPVSGKSTESSRTLLNAPKRQTHDFSTRNTGITSTLRSVTPLDTSSSEEDPPRPSAPRLTLTSPSNHHIDRLSFSSEEPFMPLSQLALAHAQPNYKSPTYSIYNMYDGDDESVSQPLSRGPSIILK